MRKQKLIQTFIPGIAIILAPVYLLTTCASSYAEVPQTAYIKQPATLSPSMTVHSGSNRSEASLDLPMKWYDSLWVPNDGSGARATLRFYNSASRDMGTKIDAIPRKGLTKYVMPCKAVIQKGADFTVTWENGNGRACEKGLKVTSKGFGKITQRSFPQASLLAQGEKSTQKVYFDTLRWNSKSLLKAEAGEDDIADSSTRYYCSALPTSGGGSAGIAAGFDSAAEACSQATQKCSKNNSGSECSIKTMGEWSVNDPELMTSVTCENGKSSRKRVSGSDIKDPSSSTNAILDGLLRQVLGDLGGILSEVLKLKPGACVLEVYHPDEVLISPVTSQQTVVQATDVGNGSVQVNVQEGQALMRSTQSPKGIVASQGQSYIFNGEGVINQGQVTRPYSPPNQYPDPAPSPSPSPIY